MIEHRDIERFHICRRCKGTNTERIGIGDNYYSLSYVGWCFDCQDGYRYQINVVNVWDKENRI